MTLRIAILAAHHSRDRERRNLLMREAVRRGTTIGQLAALVGASKSTVHGWVGARESVVGDPLAADVEALGLVA